MTVELIGLIALALGITSMFLGPAFITYIFLAFTLLGAAAASVLESLGGTNISPGHLLLAFLCIKLLTSREISYAAAQGLVIGRPGFWLFLTLIYGTISAFVMPRLFYGQTEVFLVRALDPYSVWLAPTMSNLTQSIYLTADFICFIVLYGYASNPAGRKILASAAFVCVILNLIFGALDLLTYFTGTTELFAFIRNANYSMLSDTEVAGFKRIVGSFSEASSYAYATIGYLGFSLQLWLLGIRVRLSAAASLLSLLALVFSTSTTAYVGLGALLVFFYLQIVARAMQSNKLTPQMMFFLVGAPILFLILVIAIALNDNSAAYMKNLLDEFVFNKMSTDSGIERSSWNRQGMQNFFDTFGFGVGNGSVRTSSFPIAVLASLGIIGSLLLGMFLISMIFGRNRFGGDPLDDGYRRAATSACIGWLISASVSGALVDLGLPFYAFAALASSKPFFAVARNHKTILHSRIRDERRPAPI
jgi:O-Antigen ligase